MRHRRLKGYCVFFSGEKWVTVHHTGELSEQFVTDLQNGVDIQNKTCSKVRVVEDIITS